MSGQGSAGNVIAALASFFIPGLGQLLQGRLMALFGRFGGLFVTASAFAIVHGAPAVLPIHLSIGLYLGWLRERADSLLPCILMHFLYNGTLVWLEF